MKIKSILERKGRGVFTIGPHETVYMAIGRLNQHLIGALVVVSETGEPLGIITERDVLRECGERCSRLVTGPGGEQGCPSKVEDAMSEDLIIGVPDDDLTYVMGVMTQNRIRHLPVMDGSELAGIISIGDVVNAFVEESDYENRLLKDYISGVVY